MPFEREVAMAQCGFALQLQGNIWLGGLGCLAEQGDGTKGGRARPEWGGGPPRGNRAGGGVGRDSGHHSRGVGGSSQKGDPRLVGGHCCPGDRLSLSSLEVPGRGRDTGCEAGLGDSLPSLPRLGAGMCPCGWWVPYL